MTFPPSASLENPSMPNAIHSFSSAASEVEPPVWPKILLHSLVIYSSLRLLWRLTDFVVSTSCVTANDIRAVNRRLAQLLIVLHFPVLSSVAGFVSAASVLTRQLADFYRRYHPSLLLEALKRSFPKRITIVDARQKPSTMPTHMFRCGAEMRAYAQQVEEQRALSLALLKLCDIQKQLCETQKQLTDFMTAESAA